MASINIAIIGSGIAATAIAHRLVSRGHTVTIFEKGPEYPYPHTAQFQKQVIYGADDIESQLPRDLDYVQVTGEYRRSVMGERRMRVGGSATSWSAITPRMIPSDFKTKTLFGYGDDWPIGYDALEPYYCQAEALLGVSGTDADNPFAPPRSRPHPLPPFALSYDDRILADRLQQHGIVMHTTPQARTRESYEDRPGCQNYGACHVCPIGARYSPMYHLQKAVSSGRCTIVPNVSVRRIVADRSGRVTSLVYQPNDGGTQQEFDARWIVLAAGAVESARLLLLSKSDAQPNGLGNESGHVGAHLAFHHVWKTDLTFPEPLFPERVGAWTGQSHQFVDGPERGRYAGIKLELASRSPIEYVGVPDAITGEQVLEKMRPLLRTRQVGFHAESPTSERNSVTLSTERDRLGDPFAHLHYESSEIDYETHRFAAQLLDRIAESTGADKAAMPAATQYSNGAHHMGTCRMGFGPSDSVVDSFGRVHSSPNLFLAGSSIFCGPSGAMNPTLTIVALALRSADCLVELLPATA
jgi:glucose dehydrogenase